jgi:DNA-binding CsgD family transcriptional regulator
MTTLQIAPRTLRHHLQDVMEKIGVQERTQAVVWALENGLGEKRLREMQESYGADEK